MIIPDFRIIQHVNSGLIGITPFDKKNVHASRVDLHLSKTYRDPVLDMPSIDLSDPPGQLTEEADMSEDGIVIQPGDFLMLCTNEIIRLPADISARVTGLFTLSMLGFVVMLDGGELPPGHEGAITLPVANHARWEICVRPGQRIAQISFTTMLEAAEVPYQGSYHGEKGPAESRYIA